MKKLLFLLVTICIISSIDADAAKKKAKHVVMIGIDGWASEAVRMAPAAGGIVVQDGKFVSIVRHGIPDLPKGHIEKGESSEQAALREVEEETGIGKLRIVRELPSTWHCYWEHEEWKLKRTYWYLMESEENYQPKPQTEEGISEVKLIGNEEIEAFLKNTFRSISEILEKDLHQIVTK